VPEVLNSKLNLTNTVESLFKLFKIDFYAEKYVRIFEEMFDLDSVLDIFQLQEIVNKLEQKRDEEQNLKNNSIILVNKVLVQHFAIMHIV